ncbi:hypothetical protein [Sphingomonas sp.]|uniref:hypothetical protein n=1 Tax=Sphingomonas sp. TaxID=28214 RepID=UPI001B1E3C5B|nr:hypothetical protein [Sphingomonas sp.]MBO9713931.1 hypothetical protein [Sphingomonas sp.]
MHKARKLERLLRVRTLQLGQVRAEEAAARARFGQEAALRERIAQLVAGVAPAQSAGFGATMIAAAHYRERLHQSAHAADRRVEVAANNVSTAASATQEARRDQSAIEKLIAREKAEAALEALRALEKLPATVRNRHDPC